MKVFLKQIDKLKVSESLTNYSFGPVVSRLSAVLLIAFCLTVFTYKDNAAASSVKSTKVICLACHDNIAGAYKMKVKHAPFKQGKCTECHMPHASKFDKLLYKEGGDLCFKCHKPFAGDIMHDPVVKGGCLSCHDPHASNNKGLLQSSGGSSCLECHEKKQFTDKKSVHPLVKKLNCAECHSPHSSSIEGLLVKPKKALCVRCHDAKSQSMTDKHRGYSVRGADCIGCHNPHSSDSKNILQTFLHKPFKDGNCSTCHISGSKKLKDNSVNLCLKCHESTLESFNKPKNHLLAGKSSNFCLDCHGAHGASEKAILKSRDHEVCYACHQDSKHTADATRFQHPGLKKCTACHKLHGADDSFMLKDGGTGTCSTAECHASQGNFTHPVGPGIIDHRTNKEMDCATCHAVMGADFKPILRGDKDRGICIECHSL